MGKLFLISGNEDFTVKERASQLVVSLCGENPEDNTALEIKNSALRWKNFSVPWKRLRSFLRKNLSGSNIFPNLRMHSAKLPPKRRKAGWIRSAIF